MLIYGGVTLWNVLGPAESQRPVIMGDKQTLDPVIVSSTVSSGHSHGQLTSRPV